MQITLLYLWILKSNTSLSSFPSYDDLSKKGNIYLAESNLQTECFNITLPQNLKHPQICPCFAEVREQITKACLKNEDNRSSWLLTKYFSWVFFYPSQLG